SHIVNGCTRLQPPVMLMGQALGTIAHEALQSSSAPREANIARVQTQLIASGCPLYILYDISPDHPQFATLQRLAQRGILRDDDSLHAALDETIDGATATRWLTRAELSTDRIDEGATTVQRRSLPEALSARLRGRGGPLTREDVLSAIAAHLD
ncbi:MAG: FAD-dependent oxidoreductase, partial [Bacteroidetes bacterium]|nr:FAD-dependent oxidoreductase [Bacteroidota bacterium]